jgi:hypothetical protein
MCLPPRNVANVHNGRHSGESLVNRRLCSKRQRRYRVGLRQAALGSSAKLFAP